MARTLALDVGDRRIGVAVSDATKLIARPLCVVDRKRGDPVARVVALVSEQAADEVVVGFPVHADGNISEQARQVQAFVESLRAHLADVPIRLVDERYTTQDARQIIATIRRRRQPRHDDAIAAAVILQRYLDER